MATATRLKPSQLQEEVQQTGTWSDTFPKQQVTEQESLRFMKKLLAVAVSHIAYLRVIFPERAFGDRSLEGIFETNGQTPLGLIAVSKLYDCCTAIRSDLNLKILRNDKSCPGAAQVIDWLKGVFDALDKKYLRVLTLGIYRHPDDPNTLIEAYTFRFSYNDRTEIDIYRNNTKISSTNATEETRKATISLLHTLVVLVQTLKPLPSNFLVTMKLFYYDEVTPSDYEPPGFKAANSDTVSFEDETMKIRVGDVSTLFHCMKVRLTADSAQFKMQDSTAVAADIDDSDENSENIAPQQHVAMEGLDNEDDEGVGLDNEDDESQEINQTTSEKLSADPSASSNKTSNTAKENISEKNGNNIENQNDEVQCPCGCNEDDGLMILCAVCHNWQHGVCFLIKNDDEAPEHHICNMCCKPEISDLKPTDPSLVGLSQNAVEMTCLWRRALMACTEADSMTMTGLANRLGIKKTLSVELFQRLEKEGFLVRNSSSKRGKLTVDCDKLTQIGLVKYFQKTLNDHQKVQSVVVQTSKLSITTSKPSKSGKSSTPSAKLTTEIKDNSQEKSASQPSTKNKRKRVRSAVQECEFEVSNTQEDEYNPQELGRKRCKTSIVKKGIEP